MELITLLENTCDQGCTSVITKHGLSLYIKTEEKKILFDTGPDDSFIHNAKALGINLEEVDILVISHAHYDHGGGLEDFLTLNHRAQVFLSPKVKGEYYAKRSETEFQYIGLEQTVLENNKARLTYIAEKTEISPGITLLKTTEHSTFVPRAILLKKIDDSLTQDQFEHELIMVIEEQGVLHVFTGCSHNGIINMVLTVEKEFPNKKIQTLIGGFHLMNTKTKELGEEEETVKGIAQVLLEHDIAKIYTGHCTGQEALGVLQHVLGEKISAISTGKKVSISTFPSLIRE